MGPESLLLHYHSHRPGLWPLVVGILRSMAAEYFGIADLGIELVAARHTGDCDHEASTLPGRVLAQRGRTTATNETLLPGPKGYGTRPSSHFARIAPFPRRSSA